MKKNKETKPNVTPSHKRNKNRKVRDCIIPTTANIVLPIALVLGVYVILHGHLSPGGGFQGGVLIASAVAILFIAYGSERIAKTFNMTRLKIAEDIGALGFILVATLGVVYGSSFFMNVINHGTPGKLYSSGTIFWMNFAVGYKVLAGIGFLILMMVGALKSDSKEE